MIEGLHQRHYKNAIISVLEDWGGQAYGRDVIDALLNDPKHKIELTYEEKVQADLGRDNTFKHACRAAVEQLRKDAYIEKVTPNKRGIRTCTQKPYIPTGY
jgi:hypothetical protein